MIPAQRVPAHIRGPATRTNGSVTAAAYITRGMAVRLPNPPEQRMMQAVMA